MRLSPLRAGVTAAALGTTMTLTGAVSTPAQERNQGTASAQPPTASIAKVGVGKRKLNVHAGRRAVVKGTVLPRVAGLVTYLQIRTAKRWVTIGRDRTGSQGRYRLRDKRTYPMSARVRVVVRAGGDKAKRRIGRMNVYRHALASWYGPGFYGHRLACGGTLKQGTVGVAHKTLPCGTKITLHNKGRTLQVKVIDRGPYVGGRYYDLTAATKQKLGFGSTGTVWSTK